MSKSATLALPATISSAQELDTMRQELREYAKWFAHNDIKRRVGAKITEPKPVLSPAASDMLRDWTASNPTTVHSLDELQTALEELKGSAPTITITLAAPAMGELRKSLVAWCRKNIAPDVLVNFRFNSALLGGMVVRYGSRVFDWSFRRDIMSNRGKFPEVLRHV